MFVGSIEIRFPLKLRSVKAIKVNKVIGNKLKELSAKFNVLSDGNWSKSFIHPIVSLVILKSLINLTI